LLLPRQKVEKAKPRAIVGRKTTGPLRTAGLPNQKEFCGPVVYTDTGPFAWWLALKFDEISRGERKMKEMTKKPNGFSLIEVMVALMILTVGLLAIAGLQITSIQGNSFSSRVTQASILAQNKLENLRNLSYDDPKLTGGQPAEQITKSGLVFTVGYDVSLLRNSIKKITTNVGWADQTNHSVPLSTITKESIIG
jgi:prepilin-type N-terminal cleavage/methylation domain-containing protein